MVNGKIEALDTPKNLKKTYEADSMNDVFLKLARGWNIQEECLHEFFM